MGTFPVRAFAVLRLRAGRPPTVLAPTPGGQERPADHQRAEDQGPSPMMIGMVMSRPVLASNIGGDSAGSVLTVVSSFKPATAAGAASRAEATLITMRVAVVNHSRV